MNMAIPPANILTCSDLVQRTDPNTAKTFDVIGVIDMRGGLHVDFHVATKGMVGISLEELSMSQSPTAAELMAFVHIIPEEIRDTYLTVEQRARAMLGSHRYTVRGPFQLPANTHVCVCKHAGASSNELFPENFFRVLVEEVINVPKTTGQ